MTTDASRVIETAMCRHAGDYGKAFCMSDCICARMAGLLAAIRAEATKAERERAAKVADGFTHGFQAGNKIAAAIRARVETK